MERHLGSKEGPIPSSLTIISILFVAAFNLLVSFVPIPAGHPSTFASTNTHNCMKKLIVVLTALYLQLAVAAQPPMGAAKGQIPTIGRVFGKLVDSTGKGIRDASVLLLQNKMDAATKKMKQVLVKGVSTQPDG